MSRIPCSVPHCGRTAPSEKYGDDCEIICRKHWNNIDRRWRRRHLMINRIMKRLDINPGRYKNPYKAINVAVEVWRVCKKQAIERAMGI